MSRSPPVAPTNLTATVTSATSVGLAWTDNSNNEIRLRRPTGRDRRRELRRNRHGREQREQLFRHQRDDRNPLRYQHPRALTKSAATPASGRVVRTADAARHRHRPQRQLLRRRRPHQPEGQSAPDATINFNWGNGAPNRPSARIRSARAGRDSSSRFFRRRTPSSRSPTTSNRVWVNGHQLVNDWKTQRRSGTNSGAIALTAGVRYAITVKLMENSGGARPCSSSGRAPASSAISIFLSRSTRSSPGK